MVFYCTTSDCLRGFMLKYFGDKHKDYCGKCSNCLTEFETVDVTVEAQKILSCIIRTGQNYGVKMITDVLREGTELIFSGDQEIIRQAFDVHDVSGQHVFLKGIVSRKKQMVPALALLWG